MIHLVIVATGVWLSFLPSFIVPNDHPFVSGPPGAEFLPFLTTTGGKLWSKALYFRVVPLSDGTTVSGTHRGTKWILGGCKIKVTHT